MMIDKLKKKIVFSDYDGTIFITEEDMLKNVEAIEIYRNLGGKFVIVTGRSKTSVSKVIKQYNIPFDYIISNNGSAIFDSNMTKLYQEPILSNVSDKIIEYLKTKENIEIHFYDDDDKVEYYHQDLLKIRIKTSDYDLAQEIEDEVNSIFKDSAKAHSNFPGRYYDDKSFVIVDIISKNAGKENSIKKLIEILDIEKEDVATIGDARNDIQMIMEYEGYSMETAEEDVKKVASKIFVSVADILKYLEK